LNLTSGGNNFYDFPENQLTKTASPGGEATTLGSRMAISGGETPGMLWNAVPARSC